MRSAQLISDPSTDDGTFGVLTLDNGLAFHTGELPWKDNASGVSCIPAGTYRCEWINSPKHGECYQITGVHGRSMIEIHSANFMGDTSKGKHSQLLGCVALGKGLGELEGQMAVLQSKVAVREFEAEMQKEPFILSVIRAVVPSEVAAK